MTYQLIENYGMIGDMHTVALVGTDGSIDWLCVPRFDSPSVFAAILDDGKGGRFKIAPVGDDVTCKQFYWPETNVLITRFLGPHGAAELTDFMPAGRAVSGGKHRLQLIRRVTAVRGILRFRMECRPAFNYARDAHTATITTDGATLVSTSLSLGLATEQPLEKIDDAVVSEFTLSEGETAVFVLRHLSPELGCGISTSAEEAEDLFRRTVEFWQRWIAQSRYAGRWREMVHRSALALKLLTYEPTGAIVAAPTCSLPEGIGGERNWDYRYAWIRDAAFTVYAFYPKKPNSSCTFWLLSAKSQVRAGRCRSCMESTGGSIWSRRRSITSTATWDQDRYASATAHITSCNSTSTANFSTPLISTTSTGRRSHTTCGPL
jgi:GH15 family glucan-1,4-alpha-glucosidase